MKKTGKKGMKKPVMRKPVATKPSGPMSTPKGKKGYDRKQERRKTREEIKGEQDE